MFKVGQEFFNSKTNEREKIICKDMDNSHFILENSNGDIHRENWMYLFQYGKELSNETL